MNKFDNEFRLIKERILAAENIAILTHINPDGDCFGSAAALVELIKKLGKNALVFNEQGRTDYFSFIIDEAIIDKTPENDGRKFDLVIFVDCGEPSRTGKVAWVAETADFTITIDHHATSVGFSDINVIDDTAAATGILIYELYQSLEIEIDSKIAQLIYMAICTDSGNFSYSNTDRRAHETAGRLLEYHIDLAYLTQKLFRETTYNKLKLTELTYATLHMYENGQIAAMHTSKAMFNQTGTTSDDSEGFVSRIRDIKGVKVAAFLRDTTDGKFVKISLRSNGNIDVSKIAASLGGGGHFNAAGLSLEGTIPQIEEKIVEILKKEIQ